MNKDSVRIWVAFVLSAAVWFPCSGYSETVPPAGIYTLGEVVVSGRLVIGGR